MSVKRVMIGAGDLCACALTLLLALLIGDGRALSGWIVWYLAALAFVAVLGLYVRANR